MMSIESVLLSLVAEIERLNSHAGLQPSTNFLAAKATIADHAARVPPGYGCGQDCGPKYPPQAAAGDGTAGPHAAGSPAPEPEPTPMDHKSSAWQGGSPGLDGADAGQPGTDVGAA